MLIRHLGHFRHHGSQMACKASATGLLHLLLLYRDQAHAKLAGKQYECPQGLGKGDRRMQVITSCTFHEKQGLESRKQGCSRLDDEFSALIRPST